MRIISPKTAKRILSMMGWRGMDEAIPAPKCIILGAPLGGIPVDRTTGGGAHLVRQMIEEFEKDEYFQLAIAPEGTRRPVKRWKGGFHLIAKATGVPVFLGYFDHQDRRRQGGVPHHRRRGRRPQAHKTVVQRQRCYRKIS